MREDNGSSFEGDRAVLRVSQGLGCQEKLEAFAAQRAALWGPKQGKAAKTQRP